MAKSTSRVEAALIDAGTTIIQRLLEWWTPGVVQPGDSTGMTIAHALEANADGLALFFVLSTMFGVCWALKRMLCRSRREGKVIKKTE